MFALEATESAQLAAAASGKRARWPVGLLVGMVIVHLLPVWWFRYLPFQDGPSHLENAAIMGDLVRGNERVRQFYELNYRPEPNLIGHALLAGMMSVVSPRTSETILVSLYILLLPVSMMFVARVVSGSGGNGLLAAVLAIPFIYSQALHRGLYNFCLSLPLFFFLIGYFVRHRNDSKLRSALILMALSLFLFFCHGLSLGMAYIAIAVFWFAGSSASASNVAKQGEAIEKRPGRSPALQVAALIPAGALLALFIVRSPGGASDHRPIGAQLVRLVSLESLASYQRIEMNLTIPLAVLLWSMAVVLLIGKLRRRTRDRSDVLLLLAAIAAALYLVAPNSAAGGGQILFRLGLFTVLFVVLWISVQAQPMWMGWAFVAPVMLLSLAMLCLHCVQYQKLSQQIEDYLSVGRLIPDGSTVLPVDATDYTPPRKDELFSFQARPMRHAFGWIACEKHLIDLGNYEAAAGYFPVRFRPEIDPGAGFDDVGSDIGAYEARIGGKIRVEYIALTRPDAQLEEKWPALRENYQLIYKSPLGMATLYRRTTR